jgi:DNA-binding beta-propeller fold protein YncE
VSIPSFELPVPRRSLRHYARQALKLAAAIIAFAAVTAVLVLVFRGVGDDDRPAVALPTETTTIIQERLYVVSLVDTSEEDFSIRYLGRVTAYDAETGEELYAIEAGSQIDAVLSPDGSRLFISALRQNGIGDDLIAVDAATGQELWRTTIQDRVDWITGLGPSALAVSPDNQRLFVYSSDASAGGDASLIPYRIQVFDAKTGDWITDFDTAYCPARLYASPDGRTLYVICHHRGSPSAIDLETGEPVTGIGLPAGVADGMAVSPDGQLLYIVSGGRVTVVDMNERAVVDERTSLGLDTPPISLLRLVALSSDGTRLLIGLGTDRDPDTSAVSSREIAVFDTATWQQIGRITTELPITGQTLAGAPGNQAVFAVHNAFREGTSIPTTASILKLSSDAEPAVFATREREEVLAIIAGQAEAPEQ